MPDPAPNPKPFQGLARRTIHRIVAEAVLVGLIGVMMLGICWEIGWPETGWVLAVAIWIGGPPLLEIVRLVKAEQ